MARRVTDLIALLVLSLGTFPAQAAEVGGPARGDGIAPAGSIAPLGERARIEIPAGVTAYLGTQAAARRAALGQPEQVGVALFATDADRTDPILITVRWRPLPYRAITEAPAPDDAQAAINREIAAAPSRIGSAGIATQFSDWIEKPSLAPDTRVIRASYSIETRIAGRTGTAFAYQALAYGAQGAYDILVESSAERAGETPGLYERLVDGFRFLPGHTYADGAPTPIFLMPTDPVQKNNLKLTLFLLALTAFVGTIGMLFWIIVWPRLREEA